MPSRLGTLEYLAQVAKDWTVARFAAAQTSDFALAPRRFEFCGVEVRRHAIAPDSLVGRSPLDTVRRVRQPTAWAHEAVLILLADTDTGTDQYEQAVVEILAMEDTEVLAEFAVVVRIEGFPPCLGPFWPAR